MRQATTLTTKAASLSSFSSRTSLHSSKSFSAKATGRETEDDIKSGKNDERNANTIGVFSKTASSSSAGAFSSSAGAFAGGEEGVDAFEGQEVIDATREETDGQTSIGQTGTVTSIQPGGLLVLEGLRSSVQLGSVLRFPGLQAKAILLSHREPKSFAMLATKLGAVHVPDSDNVAEIKVGDALEVEKMDEILENPKTATAKNLLASISKEILNPEMAAFASSHDSIMKKFQRKIRKMKDEGLYMDQDL